MGVYPSKEEDEPLSYKENLELSSVLKDLKCLLEATDNPENDIKEYLEVVEKQVSHIKEQDLSDGDKEQIKKLIEKHPYFKNPNNYYVRLITIMKYLKKKGIDVKIKDIDLEVDGIIQTIGGVQKIGYGMYKKKRV